MNDALELVKAVFAVPVLLEFSVFAKLTLAFLDFDAQALLQRTENSFEPKLLDLVRLNFLALLIFQWDVEMVYFY